MTIKINYKNNSIKKSSINLALFVDENFNVNGLKENTSTEEFSYIFDLLKTCDLKKKY